MHLKVAFDKLGCETRSWGVFMTCVPRPDDFGVLYTISVHVSPCAEPTSEMHSG